MTPNTPKLWQHLLPVPQKTAHKYERGHVIVFGGARMTGAARLAAEAAMRMGAGVCTIVAPASVAGIYQSGAPHILFEPLDGDGFAPHLGDPRRTASIIGPGAGPEDAASFRELVLDALALGKPMVLDADALTAFRDHAPILFKALHPGCVLTPHEGEFSALFGTLPGTKAEKAAAAAKLSGAIVLLKGAETIIAAPDGRLIVNAHSSPYLATAGSGDVLAGMIGGLLAGKMDPFSAACAAAWIHGDAGLRHGPGLVAPDIIALIPPVLGDLLRA